MQAKKPFDLLDEGKKRQKKGTFYFSAECPLGRGERI